MTLASWLRGLAQSASIRTSLVQLLGAVLCLAAAPAWGAIITSGPQNYSLATGFPADNATNLTFPKFDSSLGTLTKVTLSFSGQLLNVTVNYDNENTADNQTAMTFIRDIININGLGSQVINGFLFPQINQSLGSIAPDNDAVPDFVGTDSASFSGSSSLISGSSTASTPAQFVGSGTFFVRVAAHLDPTAVATPSFGALESQVVTAGTTSGTVTLTYDYTPAQAAVPEPSTLIMFGLGAFGLAISRRHRKAA